VPANFEELALLFSERALSSFIGSTCTRIALLSEGGQLLAWNPAFDLIKQEIHRSLPSQLRQLVRPPEETGGSYLKNKKSPWFMPRALFVLLFSFQSVALCVCYAGDTR
jgi:hypothetical protein